MIWRCLPPLLFLICLMAAPAAAVDTPHNRANGVACPACHGPAKDNSPFWGGAVTVDSFNGFCLLNCHDTTNPAEYSDINAPFVKTHSSADSRRSFGTWKKRCVDCHDPHSQEQNNFLWRLEAGEDLYLAGGEVTGYTVNGDGTSTIDYAGISFRAGWDAASLSEKSTANRRAVMLPNYRRPGSNFPVAGITDNGDGTGTITVEGDIGNVAGLGRYPFRIIYGQFVRQYIDHDGDTGTPARAVKFYGPTGPGGFVDPSGGDPPQGICQVCHTRTGHWSPAAPVDDDHYPAANCATLCHRHEYGFTHFNGASDRCIECHGHDAGVEYLPGLSSSGNGTSTSHSAHTEHDGDDVNGPDVECSACHDTSDYPFFKSGTDSDGDGRLGLSETDVCDACHREGTGVATGDPVPVAAPAWDTDIACSGCHGYGPDYANDSPKANSHPAHAAYSCDKCHAATTGDGITIADIGLHLNDVYNLAAGDGVSFSYSYDAAGGTCNNISCHSNTDATWGDSACLGCHSTAVNDRAEIAGQFSAGSHHIQDGTISGDRCFVCHWEANNDGTLNLTYHGGSDTPAAPVNLVIYGAGSRPSAYDDDGLNNDDTAVTYTAANLGGGLAAERAEVAKITPHCLGCHRDANNAAEPFGDGRTPMEYAWDSTSIDARYSQTGTTAWGKYSGVRITPKDTRTKAYSAHGNATANEGGWDLSEGWPNTRNGANYSIQCFDCHNSHGSGVTGPTSSYASATAYGGILKDTTGGGSGYAVSYKPVAGGSAVNKNERNAGASLCLDCHLTADGSAAGKPWGYQTTFEATQAVVGYFDSQYLAPGGAGPQQRYAYKDLEVNAGGHFDASSPLTSTPRHNINGLCTPCHDPHGVSPSLGGTQQYGVPLLKGTWLTSPYKEDAAPASDSEYRGPGTGRPWGSTAGYHIDQNTFAGWDFSSTAGISESASVFGGLCLQCHEQTGIDPDTDSTWGTMDRIHETVKGWGAGNKHQFPCSKCHSPHNGSALPRLMVTNCLDYKHRGRVASGGVAGSHSDSNSGLHGSGSGSGKFPGGGSGSGSGWENSWSGSYNFGRVSCHDSVGSGTWPDNQLWNNLTPW